jgi:Tol biopolymer transport system component
MGAASKTGHWRTRWVAVAGLLIAVIAAWLVVRTGGSSSREPAPQAVKPVRVALVYSKATYSHAFGLHPVRERIYRAGSDGTHSARIAVGLYPAISPDGRWVVYQGASRKRPPRLQLLSLAGGRPRPLPARAFDDVVWSPDSKQILAMTGLGPELVDIPAGTHRLVGFPHAGGLTFSPDGTQIALEMAQNIYVAATAGGRAHQLTSMHRDYAPVWGPDGIAFQRFGVDSDGNRCPGCRGDVWMMDSDGRNPHALTQTKAGIYPAAWSGNGLHLLAAYPATHNGRLYAVDIGAGTTRALTGFVGDLVPQGLSRDGTTVLAAVGCGGIPSPYGFIETIPFAGGKPTVIARGPCRASWNA